MAFITGTATDATDFFNKLVAFLKTDATLVAGSQQWTQQWAAPVGAPNLTAVVLRGPGLGGGDNVLVGLQLVTDVANDRHEIQVVGLTNVLAGAVELGDHVNASPVVKHFLTNTTMTYWFSANGRRFVSLAKISTVFEALYAGFILPYALPISYDYPMYIGGSAALVSEDPVAQDWRDLSLTHTNFVHPYGRIAGATTENTGSYLLSPEGAWRECANNAADDNNALDTSKVLVYPGTDGGDFYGQARRPSLHQMQSFALPGFGDVFPLMPVILFSISPGTQVYGVLDGVYATSGINNASENVITVGADNYLVFQNTFRSSSDLYAALKQG